MTLSDWFSNRGVREVTAASGSSGGAGPVSWESTMAGKDSDELGVLVGGGAVADYVMALGVANDRNMLSASALVAPKHYGVVAQAFCKFADAGATWISTANYHVSPGLGFTDDEIFEFTRLAARLADDARKKRSNASEIKIVGSLPPLTPSYRSDRTIVPKLGEGLYLIMAKALLPHVDVLLAETVSSVQEARMAYTAVHKLQKPVMVAFALNVTGKHLRSGEGVRDAIEQLIAHSAKLAKEEGTEATLSGVLFSCSQPEVIGKALKFIAATPALVHLLTSNGIVLGAYANKINSASTAGQMEERLSAGAAEDVQAELDMEVFSNFALRWLECGASLVGGCCGISPPYIKHLTETTQGWKKNRKP